MNRRAPDLWPGWVDQGVYRKLRGLQAWYRHASVQRVIAEMAPALAHQQSVSRYNLLSLMEVAGVGSIPEPRWSPVIAPARYQPGAAAPPRRATTPVSSQRRPASTAGVDLHRFARDANDRIRPFTHAEWAYIKEHGLASVQSIRPFSEAELETVLENMEDAVARQQGR